MADTHGAERGLQRFEGFTDAVFAIALTLLIVEIKPPGAPEGPQAGPSLLEAIASQWRELTALLLELSRDRGLLDVRSSPGNGGRAHAAWRKHWLQLVKQQPDLEVVGHVQSPHALVRQCRTGCVDVVSQG